jgi:hypothetical protein
MFVKDSKPWTSKQQRWFGAFCALCVTSVVAAISYEVWMQSTIFQLTQIRIQRISVLALPCSPQFFWGHSLVYKRVTDDYERYGYVCRDWSAGRWILANPQTGRID